jgi:hypothetical protein
MSLTRAAARAKKASWVAPLLFFGLFALAGAAATVVVLGVPLAQVVRARSWNSVPCRILSSAVARDGKTYKVVVRYAYEVGGAQHEGDRYQFLGGSSSGTRGKQAIVDRLPPGSLASCWVNPARPSEAVIERGPTADMLTGVVPVVFLIVGLAGLRWALRLRRAPAPSPDPPAPPPRGRAVIAPATGPKVRLFGALFLTLFWNGIVSVFVREVVQSVRAGASPWGFALFLTPFVLIGLVGIGVSIYYFLALFNPRPVVTLTPAAVPLGGSTRVEWELLGNASRIDALVVTLEAREEAEYQRGTRTETARSTFLRLQVATGDRYGGVQRGSAVVRIPEDAMHSFASRHNKVVWVLKLHGAIAWWPDVNEEFPFEVRPLETAIAAEASG